MSPQKNLYECYKNETLLLKTNRGKRVQKFARNNFKIVRYTKKINQCGALRLLNNILEDKLRFLLKETDRIDVRLNKVILSKLVKISL